MWSQLQGMYRKYRDEGAPLIYQMGKVGSTTLEHGMPSAINVHTLYGNSPCAPHYQLQIASPWGWLRHKFPFWLKRFALRRRATIKIVTLVRDPIARNRSMFFQDLHHWLSAYIRDCDADAKREGMELLYDCYGQYFQHDYFDKWFDKEIKRFSGIDIFAHPYQPGMAQIIEQQNVAVFVVRLEDLAANLPRLEEFLGVTLVKRDANRADKKWYADAYQQFLTHCPSLTCETDLYQTKTAKHFAYSRPAK